MTHAKIVAGLMLATCLAAGPASAAGLLGGVVTGLTSTVSGLTQGSAGGTTTVTNAVGGVLDSATAGGGVSVPGVASLSTSNTGGTNVDASLLGGGGSTLNVGLGSVIGGTSNIGVTLPGSGNSFVDGAVSGVAGTANGLVGNGGALGDLLTDSGLSGTNGGLGGLTGGDGGLFGNDGSTVAVDDGAGGRMIFANYGANCIGPDPRAIGRLLQSRSYSKRTLDSWHRAANVQVVPVRLCPATRGVVRRELNRNRSVGVVQTLAEADPLIRTSLSRTRYGAANVLAVDQVRGTLMVYVY
jgi:hypothetical protein